MQIRVRKGPVQPTAEQVMKHNATHLPFRDWCVPCIAEKAPGLPHSRITCSSTAVPMCQMDYFFLNRRGDTDILTVLNLCSVVTKAQQTTLCNRLRHSWISWGVKKICLPTDGELASGAPAQAIKIARNDETKPETTPRYSSSPLGAVGRSNRSVEGHIRCMRIALGKSADKSFGIEDNILV